MATQIGRRMLLQTLGLGAATAVAAVDNSRVATRTGQGRRYNFDSPQDSIEAYTRIRGDIAGKRVFTYTRGRVYVVQPGQAATPFLAYESGLVDEYRAAGDAVYLQTRREIMHFIDLETGGLAKFVANPITGRRNRPIHGLVGPLKFAVTPRGIAFNTHDPAQAPGKPLALLWETRPTSTVVTMETLRRYRNSQQPAEWPSASTGEYRCYEDFLTYTVDSKALRVSANSGLEAQLFYSGQTDLQPWMFAGQTPGHNLWHATGFKTTRFGDLPKSFVRLTNELHPGIWDDPFGYTEKTESYEDKLRARLEDAA
jgi:Protein of unknown function (DUF1838)